MWIKSHNPISFLPAGRRTTATDQCTNNRLVKNCVVLSLLTSARHRYCSTYLEMNKSNNSGRRERILVVDDNEDMRLTMKALLEHEGYEVELAANGREALEVQRARPARVLVTDLFMPDADGFETIERFRKE